MSFIACLIPLSLSVPLESFVRYSPYPYATIKIPTYLLSVSVSLITVDGLVVLRRAEFIYLLKFV